jgi:carboxymethylenebutenolidase
MGEHVTLRAEDGHKLDAYVATPAGEPIAALAVTQEIFGVNAHIRSVADRYAAEGFLAVAPALFDRFERGVELKYEGEDMQRAIGFAKRLNMDDQLKDTGAAISYGRGQTNKKAGIIGYCLGGSIAWLAACRLRVDAAVGYYGGQIAQDSSEQPRCPVMLHFGNQDKHILPEAIERIRTAHPDIPIYVYNAGHGFNCDARSVFEPASANLAHERSLAFLRQNLT